MNGVCVTISEAAKLAGISRTHLYRKYIKPGTLSVSKDELGKPSVDISELLRVFGVLQGDNNYVTNGDREVSQVNSSTDCILLEKIKGLEALLKAKEEELEGYRGREKFLYRLLEHKPSKKRWWPF